MEVDENKDGLSVSKLLNQSIDTSIIMTQNNFDILKTLKSRRTQDAYLGTYLKILINLLEDKSKMKDKEYLNLVKRNHKHFLQDLNAKKFKKSDDLLVNDLNITFSFLARSKIKKVRNKRLKVNIIKDWSNIDSKLEDAFKESRPKLLNKKLNNTSDLPKSNDFSEYHQIQQNELTEKQKRIEKLKQECEQLKSEPEEEETVYEMTEFQKEFFGNVKKNIGKDILEWTFQVKKK